MVDDGVDADVLTEGAAKSVLALRRYAFARFATHVLDTTIPLLTGAGGRPEDASGLDPLSAAEAAAANEGLMDEGSAGNLP